MMHRFVNPRFAAGVLLVALAAGCGPTPPVVTPPVVTVPSTHTMHVTVRDAETAAPVQELLGSLRVDLVGAVPVEVPEAGRLRVTIPRGSLGHGADLLVSAPGYQAHSARFELPLCTVLDAACFELPIVELRRVPSPTPGPSSPVSRELSIDEARDIVQGTPGLGPGTGAETQARALDRLHAAGDRRWGLHQDGLTGNRAHDIVALNVRRGPSPHQLFDFISGVEGPSPGWAWTDQTGTERAGSTFVPWTRRATRLTVQGTTFLRDGAPVRLAGLTSFDLGVRLRDGDARWLTVLEQLRDQVPPTVAVYARVVPASLYRTSRTLAEGRAMLPPVLEALAARGIYAEVTFADSKDYGLTGDQILAEIDALAFICAQHANCFFESTNEVDHATVADEFGDSSFRRAVIARMPDGVPASAGSSHGGEDPRYAEGHYLTHHAPRGPPPESNAATMAAAQRQHGKPVLDDEPLGIAEVRRPGSREADPELAYRQARAAVVEGLAGTLLHLDAGLTSNVDLLGPVQRAALERFAEGLR